VERKSHLHGRREESEKKEPLQGGLRPEFGGGQGGKRHALENAVRKTAFEKRQSSKKPGGAGTNKEKRKNKL